MIYFTEEEINQLIREDIPYLDLTSTLLGVGPQPARIRFITRHPTVVCATEEAVRILENFGLKIGLFRPSGIRAAQDTPFLEATGTAGGVHAAWRAALNLLEHASGIATRTAAWVDKVRAINQKIVVVTTRKSIPFTKKLSIKAILAGGALPHRLGLSETVLVFDEHLRFVGGIEPFLKRVADLRASLGEKMIAVEAHSVKSALALARGGVDLVQLDKLSPEDTRRVVETVRAESLNVKISIAGGVTFDNCADYAAAGVDIIVTSALYFGKPADIQALIEPL